MSEREHVPASQVREWAIRNGFEVGSRGLLPADVIRRFNQVHRYYQFQRWPNIDRVGKRRGNGPAPDQ